MKLNLNKKTKEILILAVAIIFTSILRAVAIKIFIAPSELAPGGISGIASIIYNKTGFNISLSTLLMNIPLITLAYIYINKKFAISTLICTAVTSLFIFILEVVPIENFADFRGDLFVSAVCGGALTGAAIGILLKVNCSTGGTDIVSLLIQNRFPSAKVIFLLFGVDAIIAVIGAIVFEDFTLLVYSVITMLASTFTADILQKSFVSTVEVKIVTDKVEKIADFIIKQLKRDLTVISATGYYTGDEKKLLITVLRKRQAVNLKKFIKETDESAFFFMTSVSDVIGFGFNQSVTPKSSLGIKKGGKAFSLRDIGSYFGKKNKKENIPNQKDADTVAVRKNISEKIAAEQQININITEMTAAASDFENKSGIRKIQDNEKSAENEKL